VATQAAVIIDAAIATSLANDEGRSDLASSTPELLNVLNRKLQQLYVLAGTPPQNGGAGKGDFFATSTTLALAAVPVALPAAAFRHIFTNADGRVSVVPRADVVDGIAEIPPAVIVEAGKVIGAGRTGDPGTGTVLTIRFTPLPGTLSDVTHYIGATTPADASTSAWPDSVGNPYLVAWLALYLARKAGDREAAEIESLTQELEEAAGILATHVGIEATLLVDGGAA
jgi:hypothetical protein